MENIEKIKPSGIFTNYIFKSIPLAFDESLSYYETLCGVLKLLKDQEKIVNQNANALIELQNYVVHYFDNLDVQEEINNKLDEMVEQGTLQEIIASYLDANAIWCFDNIEDLKNGGNLINGSFAKTLGFYEKNDGGSGLYKISTNEPTNYHIQLDNGLYAELIVNSKLNLKSIGLKTGDTTFDNSEIFEIIENYFINYKLYIPNGNYYFQDGIKLDKIDLEMEENATLTLNSSDTINCFIRIRTDDNKGYIIGSQIKGGVINCNNKSNTAIGFNNIRCFDISTKIYNFNQVGINTSYSQKSATLFAGAETLLNNCIFKNDTFINSTIAILDNGNDNIFTNIIVQDIETAVVLGGGTSINGLHHWLSGDELYPNSTTIKIVGGANTLTNIIVDTIATAVEFLTDYMRASISGLNYYWSAHVINTTYLATINPTIFKLKTLNSLYITNAIINLGNGNYKLVNDEAYSSYRSAGVNTTKFINIDNSIYQGDTNLTNILVTPLNTNAEFNSLLGYINNNGLTRASNYDNVTKTGVYSINTYTGSDGVNIPITDRNTVGVLTVTASKDMISQMYVAYDYSRIAFRSNFSGNWSNWMIFAPTT